MKKCFAIISLLIALLFFTTQLYAGSSPGLTSENKILLASVEDKDNKEVKEIKEKKGTASRKDGFDGKSSRKKGKHGKDKRIKDKKK